MLSRRVPCGGFIAPCLPTNAPQPPSGEEWLHEIEHDGFPRRSLQLSLNEFMHSIEPQK
jgi:hypothetical protein